MWLWLGGLFPEDPLLKSMDNHLIYIDNVNISYPWAITFSSWRDLCDTMILGAQLSRALYPLVRPPIANRFQGRDQRCNMSWVEAKGSYLGSPILRCRSQLQGRGKSPLCRGEPGYTQLELFNFTHKLRFLSHQIAMAPEIVFLRRVGPSYFFTAMLMIHSIISMYLSMKPEETAVSKTPGMPQRHKRLDDI